MATLINIEGHEVPHTGMDLASLQKAVGGYIQIIPTKDGRSMVINEEGKLNDLPFNEKATNMAHLFTGDYVVGNVVVCDSNELDEQ